MCWTSKLPLKNRHLPFTQLLKGERLAKLVLTVTTYGKVPKRLAQM